MTDNPADASPAVQTMFGLGQPNLRSSDFHSVYSNSVKMRVTAWDITLVFQRVTEMPPGILALEDLTEITMTATQAKTLGMALTEAVKSYEETFGEIVLDPVMMPNLDMVRAVVTNVKAAMMAQREQVAARAAEVIKAAKGN
jgi:hypothetical protein